MEQRVDDVAGVERAAHGVYGVPHSHEPDAHVVIQGMALAKLLQQILVGPAQPD
jgi:hypothetical protein